MSQRIVQKLICPHLHAMSDFGHSSDPNSGERYSRAHTNNMECYLINSGRKCKSKGRCLIVKIQEINNDTP